NRVRLPWWAGTGPGRCKMKVIHLDREQTKEIERRRHETHDRRIYERLSAVLWVVAGKDCFDVADLLGRSVRHVAEWLRISASAGLPARCTLPPAGLPISVIAVALSGGCRLLRPGGPKVRDYFRFGTPTDS